jgi:hypothetical protein
MFYTYSLGALAEDDSKGVETCCSCATLIVKLHIIILFNLLASSCVMLNRLLHVMVDETSK